MRLPENGERMLRMLHMPGHLWMPEARGCEEGRERLLRLLQVPAALRLPQDGQRLLRLLHLPGTLRLPQEGGASGDDHRAALQPALGRLGFWDHALGEEVRRCEDGLGLAQPEGRGDGGGSRPKPAVDVCSGQVQPLRDGCWWHRDHSADPGCRVHPQARHGQGDVCDLQQDLRGRPSAAAVGPARGIVWRPDEGLPRRGKRGLQDGS
mmetsp:Transcript_77621/g.222397  ORF Transcript_77621/g.222397 Transcript_77621/m.222397 type:complete len:208 (+) Transcript_77621:394-1017(+)